MKAKKLPSGKWRCRLYCGVDNNGKKIYKSFTADTKRKAELLASSAFATREQQIVESGKLYDLCMDYLKVKSNILAPTTLLNYRRIFNKYVKGSSIGDKDISKLKKKDVQMWVNDISTKVSPKTVKNVYGAVHPVFDMYVEDFHMKVATPPKNKAVQYSPEAKDVEAVIQYFIDRNDEDMLVAICLASARGLRRGEIVALNAEDIVNGIGIVSKDMTRSADGKEWVIKNTPKTSGSYRKFDVPQYVLDHMPKSGRLVNISPDQITNRFARATNATGKHFRFHDLRHFWATIAHYIGCPPRIIQDLGGWSSTNMMTRVYWDAQDDEKMEQQKRIGDRMDEIILGKLNG